MLDVSQIGGKLVLIMIQCMARMGEPGNFLCRYLFGQVSTLTGHYQLPIFGCTECTHEDAPAHNLGMMCINDVMSYNSLTSQKYVFN